MKKDFALKLDNLLAGAGVRGPLLRAVNLLYDLYEEIGVCSTI
jgi:hypothetical protein